MQPTIVCGAAVPGMVYINGRFAGEAGPDRPLFLPVSPSGAVYLEYRPLAGTGPCLARRLVLSGGMPLPESFETAVGLSGVIWPGGVLEVEFAAIAPESRRFMIDGVPGELRRDEGTALLLGDMAAEVPDGAMPPRLLRLDGAAALLGEVAGGGQYLLALSADLTEATGLIVARAIEPIGSGQFDAVVALGDSVGHGRLEQWLVDGAGPHLLSSQSAWSEGFPRWPDTAEATAVAAVEAMLADLPGEAEGYLSPALAAEKPLAAVAGACELCVPMKYAVPDARPCVGLLKAENPRLARVRPLYYRAEPIAGPQGAWQITGLSLE